MTNFFIVGGDGRQRRMEQLLSAQGYPVFSYQGNDGDLPKEKLKEASIILGPVPFSRDKIHIFQAFPEVSEPSPSPTISRLLDGLHKGQLLFGGGLPAFVRESCQKNGILWKDFMEMEEIALENAIATAEGAICLAIRESPFNLHLSRCLILGYGRCGQALADRLRGMMAEVTVCEKSPIKRTLALTRGFLAVSPEMLGKVLPGKQLIFNTVPAPVLTGSFLQKIPKETALFELASPPGCADETACHQADVRRIACPGLPGRFSPDSSARILCRAVLRVLGEGQ